MKDVIREFIETKVSKGQYFDSHAIISYLIQKYPDVYLQNIGNYKDVNSYHGLHIAGRLIGSFVEDGIIKKIGEKVSISKNIKDDFSPCTLWQKQ